MQILVHVPVFECIVGSLLGGVDGGVEMLQLGSKAHADFEWIRHIKRISLMTAHSLPRRTKGGHNYSDRILGKVF